MWKSIKSHVQLWEGGKICLTSSQDITRQDITLWTFVKWSELTLTKDEKIWRKAQLDHIWVLITLLTACDMKLFVYTCSPCITLLIQQLHAYWLTVPSFWLYPASDSSSPAGAAATSCLSIPLISPPTRVCRLPPFRKSWTLESLL